MAFVIMHIAVIQNFEALNSNASRVNLFHQVRRTLNSYMNVASQQVHVSLHQSKFDDYQTASEEEKSSSKQISRVPA